MGQSKSLTWSSPASSQEGPLLGCGQGREVHGGLSVTDQLPFMDKYANFLNPQQDSSKVCFLQSLGEFPEDLSPVAHSCNLLTTKCSWTFLPSLAHFTHSFTELPEIPSPENIPAPSPCSASVWEKPKQGPWHSQDWNPKQEYDSAIAAPWRD